MKGHVTVLVRLHVIHPPGSAFAPQEGQGRDVKKVDFFFLLKQPIRQLSIHICLSENLSLCLLSVCIFCLSDCGGDRFGPDCFLPCQCSHGAHCDGLTGRCLCQLTWLGPTCSEGIPELSLPHTHTHRTRVNENSRSHTRAHTQGHRL